MALGDVHADPDRLRRPLRPTASGWEEVSWKAALDEAAARLAAVQKAHGRNAVALYQGLVALADRVGSPHGWGHGRAGVRLAVASARPGVSINDLTDEALVDPLSGTARLNGVPIEVTPAG